MEHVTLQATTPRPVDIAKTHHQVREPLTLVRCIFLLPIMHACLICRLLIRTAFDVVPLSPATLGHSGNVELLPYVTEVTLDSTTSL